MTPRLLSLALVVAVTGALVASPVAPAHESTGSVIVTVSSSNGSAVANLTADDFVVQVDKHTESLTAFSAASPPLSVLALFDQSASLTEIRGRLDFGDAAQTLSSALHPGDSIRVGLVAGSVTISPRGTATKRDIESALKALPRPQPFASSPLWDAVADGARALSDDTGRRLLILVTDGRATASRLSTAEAATSAALASVAVSTVDYGFEEALLQDSRRRITVRSAPLLQWVSRMTGGIYYVEEGLRYRQAPTATTAIAQTIRDQRVTYQLTVAVPNDQQFHAITVRVVQPDCRGCTVNTPSVIHATPGIY